jgi:hemicentin
LGKDAVLECPASGVPEPSVQWTRNSQAILSSADQQHFSLEQNNQTLVIHRVSAGDEGDYACAVQNAGGRDSEQFQLEVLGKLFLNSLNIYLLCF